jgi:DnaJ-class molecular chaperone
MSPQNSKVHGTYCKACGGDGWLASLPEGQSECPYCRGTGKILGSASAYHLAAYGEQHAGPASTCVRCGMRASALD